MKILIICGAKHIKSDTAIAQLQFGYQTHIIGGALCNAELLGSEITCRHIDPASTLEYSSWL